MRLRCMNKQYALAVALKVNESSISRWREDGPISLDNAIALCRVLDISLDWFLTGNGSIDQHKLGLAPDDRRERLLRAMGKLPDEAHELLIALIDILAANGRIGL